MALVRNARRLVHAWLFALAMLGYGCALPLIGATPGRSPDREGAAGRSGLTLNAQRPLTAYDLRDGDGCYRALAGAGVAFERVPRHRAGGVEHPVLLRGPIAGVEVAPSGGKTTHAILDCRLALALLSWTPALRGAGVVRIEHYSIYRPGARTARKRRVSGHARGLAIDAARFQLRNGEVLDVLTDWEDRERGSAPCPRRPDESWPSRVLRGVVCEAVESNLFQVVLTPHHDRAHGNHVHLELKPEVNWTYVR